MERSKDRGMTEDAGVPVVRAARLLLRLAQATESLAPLAGE